jgi:hypothetical protein
MKAYLPNLRNEEGGSSNEAEKQHGAHPDVAQ